MRIHATINERTVRRTFREQEIGRDGLTVIDRDQPHFGLTVARNETKTFFVRALRPVGTPRDDPRHGGRHDRRRGPREGHRRRRGRQDRAVRTPLFADFADEFTRRQGRRWKPSTREGNRK